MSLKIRKFSLDSSVSQNGVGLSRGRKGSGIFSGRKGRTNQTLDNARLHIEELNHSLNSSTFPREQTIAEESVDGADGLSNSNSFVKHNKTFHKLFPEIPEGEDLTQAFTCALQKDGLYQGKLFVSGNHVCFYSSVLRKDTKVVIPLSSVREVKKLQPAMSLTIQTADGEKYLFVSLMNRGMCYKLLRNVCSHAQAESTNNSRHILSAENEVDFDVISSNPSMEDTLSEHLSRQNSTDHDEFPQLSSKVHSTFNSIRQNSTTDEEDNRGWTWRATNRVTSLFFFNEIRTLPVLFHIYVILLLLLLLASGYIGLRIIALEKQMISLDSIAALHHTQYKET